MKNKVLLFRSMRENFDRLFRSMRENFGRASLLIICATTTMLIFSSCDSKTSSVSEVLLTEQEKKAEKTRILEVINTYNQGANERNWQKMVTTLADEISFFGTDAGESSKNFNEFKNTMQKQWEDYEVLVYGPVDSTNYFVSIDDYARYANVIFSSYLIYGTKDAPDTLFTVSQRTLKRDIVQNKWFIESGILAVTRDVAQ